MNINREKYELNETDLTFDFDEWVALFKTDPHAFEQRRLKWSELIVNSAPCSYQRRLSGLLFQINMEKTRSKNSMDSCIRLSELMWKKFHQLRFELQGVNHKSVISTPPSSNRKFKPLKSAHILTFPYRTSGVTEF